ncbi:MAG TPA: hypothetical protein GX714_17405 [Chloroflexi bacterium]|nr:hypothetical protein [Chloroflexota bacterium]
MNGYEAKRYHYSEGAVDDLGFGRMDESSADVWVAEIGTGDAAVTVVVKAQTTFAGKDLAGVEWSGEMTVDVTDVNAPITIEAPEGVEPPGMPEDVPLMEGAENVQSVMGINTFEVEATLDEVMAFYDDEMAANGWSLDDDSVPGMRTYTKDARSAMLMAEETEAGASVTIMISEN